MNTLESIIFSSVSEKNDDSILFGSDRIII